MITGVLLTHAFLSRPEGGDWEYKIFAVGHGWL